MLPRRLAVSVLGEMITAAFLSAHTNSCVEAQQLHQQGQVAAAIELYRECIRSDPGNIQARSNLGAALAQEGRFAEAIEQDRKAIETAPPGMETPLRLNLALAYYKSARIPEATAEFEAVLRKEPGNRRAAILLAECHLLAGAPAKTIGLLRPLEAAHPDDLTVKYLLGSALLRTGDVVGGQELLDRILRNGESAEGHLLLGVGMYQAQDFPGAVREFAKAVKLRPDLPSVHSYYGQALLETGDAVAAAEEFERELRGNGADFDANLRLGEIHLARKEFSEARPLLERAALIRPGSADAQQALASVLGGRTLGAGTRPVDGPAIGSAAPPFRLRRANSGDSVSLRELVHDRPAVLVFGSYTCPQLRGAAPALNDLHRAFGSRVSFALVYVSEAHGSGSWQSTVNEREGIELPTERSATEKTEHAALCVRKLSIPYMALVDGMDRAVEKAYAAWPSRVYLVDRQGRVAFQTRLSELEFNRDALSAAIRALLGER